MGTACSRVTRVSNCGGELIRKWEEAEVKYDISQMDPKINSSHHRLQTDCESLQSKETSVSPGFEPSCESR